MRGSEAPQTVHPSLWRQGQLLIEDGLFEVATGIYQLRGFDLAVMTIVEGEHGIIVIDPLTCSETAAAALALYREHRGDRRIVAVIYTHTNVDHFGGVKGVITDAEGAAGAVEVIAPVHIMQHVIFFPSTYRWACPCPATCMELAFQGVQRNWFVRTLTL